MFAIQALRFDTAEDSSVNGKQWMVTEEVLEHIEELLGEPTLYIMTDMEEVSTVAGSMTDKTVVL